MRAPPAPWPPCTVPPLHRGPPPCTLAGHVHASIHVCMRACMHACVHTHAYRCVALLAILGCMHASSLAATLQLLSTKGVRAGVGAGAGAGACSVPMQPHCEQAGQVKSSQVKSSQTESSQIRSGQVKLSHAGQSGTLERAEPGLVGLVGLVGGLGPVGPGLVDGPGLVGVPESVGPGLVGPVSVDLGGSRWISVDLEPLRSHGASLASQLWQLAGMWT